MPDDPESIAVAFARVLRGAGLDVPVGTTLAFSAALGEVGVAREAAVYWAGRATLVRRPEHIPVYDRAFAVYWKGRSGSAALEATDPAVVLAVDAPDAVAKGQEPVGEEPGRVLTVRYSPQEVLRHKDFAAYTRAELDEARRLMADVRLVGALRRSRRHRPSRRSRGGLDLRRTVRRSLRAGGELQRLARREQSQRPRRVVLLCDVSGSMEPYARALMRFAHAAVAGGGRVEAFTLGTRLTRITRQLTSHDPDAALAATGRVVSDWSGGTRLGDSLRAFNDRWGCRGMARAAVVVILSDGWDRGEPAVLGEQMARLARVAHRIVWVNPLKASDGYAPLAGGMAAALPFVDEFVEGHSLASLERLAEVIRS